MPILFPDSNIKTLYSQNAFCVVNNTTAETSFIGTGNGLGSMLLPANFWVPGRKLELKTKGTYQTPATPGSVSVKIKLGSVVIAVAPVAASILATGSNTRELYGEAVITCYTTGTTGTIVCDGFLSFEIAAGSTVVAFSTAASVAAGNLTATTGSTSVSAGRATITVDTTVAALLDGTETWSNAQANQGTTLSQVQLRQEF